MLFVHILIYILSEENSQIHWWNEPISILKYYGTLSDQNILLVAICGYANFLELGYLVEVVKCFKGSTFVYNFAHGRCSSVFNVDICLNVVVQSSMLILPNYVVRMHVDYFFIHLFFNCDFHKEVVLVFRCLYCWLLSWALLSCLYC